MSKIIVPKHYKKQLSELTDSIAVLNTQRIRILFEMIGFELSESDFEKILAWELILVIVHDRQMVIQLNKLSAYIPNLKFVVDSDKDLFSLVQGDKKRRVWQER